MWFKKSLYELFGYPFYTDSDLTPCKGCNKKPTVYKIIYEYELICRTKDCPFYDINVVDKNFRRAIFNWNYLNV